MCGSVGKPAPRVENVLFTFAVNEIMLITDAIANNIREGKTAAINNAIATGTKNGMISFELSLYNLVKRGVITKEKAFEVANDKGTLTSLFEK